MITDLPTQRIYALSVTNISQSFTYKMAAKINWHRYGTKLCHCHRIYTKKFLYRMLYTSDLPLLTFCATRLVYCIAFILFSSVLYFLLSRPTVYCTRDVCELCVSQCG